MRCLWCGEETPDDSTYCEKCGHELEATEAASDPEVAETASDPETPEDVSSLVNDAEETASADLPDEDLPAIEQQAPDEALFEDDGFDEEFFLDYQEEEVDAIWRAPEDDPLVEPPSPPIQPVLSRGRIAIVGVIGALFSAAVILLAWAAILRVLGL